jgi:drug/metabolite transporter (DMT)-like permease
LHWLLFIALSLVWGSSFFLMKEGLKALNAFEVASIRIASAGIVLLPFLPASLRGIPRKKARVVMLSGVLGTFLPAYLFCVAETRLDSALAGILNALTPLFTLVVGAFFFHNTVPAKKWFGVFLGFAGMVLLMLSGGKAIGWGYMGYASYILLATLLYGVNVNLVNKYLHDIASLHIATVAFAVLLLPALGVLWYTGFFAEAGQAPGWGKAVAASAVLGILGTALASVLFYMLLKKAGPVFASMVTYGIPFVAVGWGISAGESITTMQVACLLVILAGVYLARK